MTGFQEESCGKTLGRNTYEKIRNGGKVCATCTEYVRGKRNSSEVCSRNYTNSFKVKVGLHQGSALSPFLFAVIMDRITDEVRREPQWTMLFADDIVICEETRKEVERRLECWRYALKRRRIKVSSSKTKYLCINGGNLFIFIFTHNQLEINQSACRNKDCE